MDLADQIDDYICSFEGIGDLTMDSLAIFIFIWAVLALFSVWLCKYLYNKYLNKNKPASTSNSRQGSVTPGGKGDKQRLSEPRELLATKTDIKDLIAKPAGGRGRTPVAVGGATGASVGGGASIRRRMVRQGSAGPENRKKRYVPPPSNVVGPETTSVTWTSQAFRWLYSDLVIVNELLISWVIALNENLKKSVQEHGVAVEIVRVLPDSPAPSLNNIFCNCDENNPADMLITFDCDAMPVLQVKTFRQKSGKVDTSHYKVTVSRLRARMAVPMNYNTLKGEMRCEGYPDIRITMNSVGAIKAMDHDEQQLQEVISEILTVAIRETVYPVDFSVYATCPRAEIEPLEMPHNMEKLNAGLGTQQGMTAGRRLLVKIVKGEGIKDAKDPYVVVEMDEPAQKNQTGTRQGSNPYWDEHFLFELAPQTCEILFEVYDRPVNANDPPKFLGLGLVSIDELAVGPASTQILSLQSRPYETQPVTGAITVDFVFIEGAEIPAGPRPYKLKEALRIGANNDSIKNGADIADAAVRALQDGALTTNGHPSKSTVIIHSVQRVELNKDGNIEVKESPDELSAAIARAAVDNSWQDTSDSLPTANTTAEIEQILNDVTSPSVMSDLTGSPTDSHPSHDGGLEDGSAPGNVNPLETTDITEFGRPNAASSPHNPLHNNYAYNGGNNGNTSMLNANNSLPRNGGMNATSPLTSANLGEFDDRGRSKKRNFFGTLKKRLSRSKTRTHSADRGALASSHNNNGTTPTGTLNGPRMGVPTLDHSRRSSISESSAISGFSSASNKTYVHEASTLVLETIENGITRHFIVPLAIAQRPRWRRKGTKLHIYNDHTFIAKHLSGSGLQCTICMKSIPRRPGKQGYECRDCQLICHKQCHIRAPQACPKPEILSMELNTFPVLTEQDINIVN